MEEKRWISSEILFTAISEQLAEGRQAAFTVTGMSMWPFLCHGRDQVILNSCVFEDLNKGDIILLQTFTGKYLLHRITKIKENRFETTGDGNCFRDGMFDKSCIRARVVCFTRKGKMIECNSLKWKLMFRFWMFLFPIRPVLLKMLRGVSKVKTRL